MSAIIHSALGKPRFDALPPLALYIHIPWCLKKCPYCDFNSHERRGDVPETRYVAALMRDLEFALPAIWGRRIISVFIGGGTPSLFSPEAIDAILAGVRARIALLPDAEVTLEANPGTFERAKFAAFKAAGITAYRSASRVSIRDFSRRSGACMTPTRRAPRRTLRSRSSATRTWT